MINRGGTNKYVTVAPTNLNFIECDQSRRSLGRFSSTGRCNAVDCRRTGCRIQWTVASH